MNPTRTDPTSTIDTPAAPVEITPAIQAALDDIGEAIFACVRRKHEKRAQEEERQRAAAVAATQKDAIPEPGSTRIAS